MASVALRSVEAEPSDSEWQSFWRGHSVASEIAMADFYGLRHILLKFLPRHGAIVEAGCGLGRYVFYFRGLGTQMFGCERLLPALQSARAWALREQPDSASAFSAADVRHLPLRDGSLSGYVSLGVIEHFPEGPSGAIAEAYRTLQPGGVAIIEVPSAHAFDGYVHRAKVRVASIVGRRRRLDESMHEEPMAPRALGGLLQQAGFTVLLCTATDLIYPAWSLGIGRRWYGMLHRAERTRLIGGGGLAVAVGIKRAATMACFVCGTPTTAVANLAMPCCRQCHDELPGDVLAAYSASEIGQVHWRLLDGDVALESGPCAICGGQWHPDSSFGDRGFTVRVCDICVRRPAVNLTLARRAVKRVWRPRMAAA